MPRSKKFDYQTAVEKELAAEPGGISLDELLRRCGLEVDRSTLFRHLAGLIKKGRVERVGKARATRYRPAAIAPPNTAPEPTRTEHPAADHLVETPERQPPDQPPALTPSVASELRQSDRAEPVSIPPATPDYSIAVKKAVRTVVRDWKRRNEVNLRIYLSLLVKREHIEEVAAAVEVELAGLHEGNLDAYGLSPLEFSRFVASASGDATGT